MSDQNQQRRRATDMGWPPRDASKLTLPLTIVGSIVISALGVSWWLSGHLHRVELGFAELKFELREIRATMDGSVHEADMRLWVEQARRLYPDLPPFPGG